MRQPFFYVKTKENVMGSDKETGSNNQIPHEELRELEGVTFEVEEPELHGDKKVRRKGVYLLPNLFTTAALFSAFYSIIASTKGQFELAAIAIFVAMVLDGLDGRIARMTNTQSAFGAEYDSLSDVMAFGLAPALLAYNWALKDYGKVGWMLSFIFVACAALRLARFNVQIGSVDKKYFIGLPSPLAAATITSLIWFCVDRESGVDVAGYFVAPMVLISGLLMVSNCKYASFKEVDFAGRVPFFAILAIVLSFALFFTDLPLFVSIASNGYAIFGLVAWLLTRRKRSEKK
tara:strand:- start:584 stop:1453 length:870 start_codon:yes stop_codon:yes gene_type:complete